MALYFALIVLVWCIVMIYTYLSLYGFRTYLNLCKLLVRLEKYLSKYPEAFSLIDTPSKRRIVLRQSINLKKRNRKAYYTAVPFQDS